MAGRPQRRARRAAEAAARGEPPPAAPPPSRKQSPRKDGSAKADQTWHEWQASRGETDRQRDQIVELMAKGSWLPGASENTLAEQWNVSPAVVLHRAREASKLLRALCKQTPEFQEEVRIEVLQTFRVIRAMALQTASGPRRPPPAASVAEHRAYEAAMRHHNPAASLGVALQATRLFGFYTGIEPAKKIEDVTPIADPFEGWTQAELKDYADSGRRPRRALAEISAGRYGIAGPDDEAQAASAAEDADTGEPPAAAGVH